MTRSQVRYLLGTPMVADSFQQGTLGLHLLPAQGPHAPHRFAPRHGLFRRRGKVAKLDKPTAEEAAAQDKSAAQIKNGRTY